MRSIEELRKEFTDLQQITKELRLVGFIAFIEIRGTTEPLTLRVKSKRSFILKVS